MPSQSVEAATRDEAIAAAREKYGPTARVVGVRRIRSGGMFGFFTNERYIAEVEVSQPAPVGGPDSGSLLKVGSREERPAPSMDDRMRELADLLGAAQEAPAAGLYGRSGSTEAPAPVAPSRSAAPSRTAAPASVRSTVTPKASSRPASKPAAAPKPFTPVKHTLMLPADELQPARPTPAAPVADQPARPSPFAAALTRMVASNPVQAAADAAVEAAAAEATAAETAAAEAAASQAAAVEAAAAEASRIAAARIDAAAAEAARVRAEATAAEAARRRAEAAAAEAARLEAEAVAAEAARRDAEAAAAEAAQIEAEAARLQAERLETERIEAERLEIARIQTEQLEAARLEAERVAAARLEAEQVEAEQVEAEQVEAERVEAERIAAEMLNATPLSMVESVRTADEELAALLEEVLTANGSGRGRHRLPDSMSAAAETAVPAGEDRVLDVPEPSAYDTGTYRTDAYAHAWTSDARVAQRAAQVAAAQNLVVDAVLVEETAAEEVRHVEARPVAVTAAVPVSLAPAMAPTMARTASDPAPLPMDATLILPALSILPPQRFGAGMPPFASGRPAVPPARRGRPPVPAVAGRPQVPTRPVPIPVPIASRTAATALPSADELGARLATVTRLVPASSPSTALAPYAMNSSEELVVRLLTLGVPDVLLGPDFSADAAVRGVYAALTRTLARRLPTAPKLPTEPGDVVMVVGPGAETFAAARSLALSMRLEPEDVQWAASGALAGLAPEASRITSLETAVERQLASASRGTVAVIAVDAPLRTSGGPWLEHMLSVWQPSVVWAVLDSTRKPEDLVPWLEGLPVLDAVVVQDTDSTADPAAVLSHVDVPVALVDGARATAHRWASLLCERLEEMDE